MFEIKFKLPVQIGVIVCRQRKDITRCSVIGQHHVHLFLTLSVQCHDVFGDVILTMCAYILQPTKLARFYNDSVDVNLGKTPK